MATSSTRPGLSEDEYRNRGPMSRMDKNIVIVTASLLGVLILMLCMLCVCEWARKRSVRQSTRGQQAPAGMNKRQLGELPSCLVDVERGSSSPNSGCAICLSDFARGDRIRQLPCCQQCFHVGCIDTWLSLHSSCPSCREDMQQLRRPPTSSSTRQAAAASCLLDIF